MGLRMTAPTLFDEVCARCGMSWRATVHSKRWPDTFDHYFAEAGHVSVGMVGVSFT